MARSGLPLLPMSPDRPSYTHGSMTSKHRLSSDDEAFRRAFEAFEIPPDHFDHGAHVRLAYAYLCHHDAEQATSAMKRSLLAYLEHLGVGTAKYHETITQAWVMAVRHFMESTEPCAGYSEFIDRNPLLLDTEIMLSHYSAEVLFSDEARAAFVTPDVSPIPKHD